MKASQKKQVVWLWLIKELDAHLVDRGEEDIPGGEMGKYKSTFGLWKGTGNRKRGKKGGRQKAKF